MGNLGWSEMLLVMVFALVVFGPQRLPEIARQIGKAMREIRRVSGAFEEEIKSGLALNDKDPHFPFMKGPIDSDSQAEAARQQPELPANLRGDSPNGEVTAAGSDEPSKPEAGGESPSVNFPV